MLSIMGLIVTPLIPWSTWEFKYFDSDVEITAYGNKTVQKFDPVVKGVRICFVLCLSGSLLAYAGLLMINTDQYKRFGMTLSNTVYLVLIGGVVVIFLNLLMFQQMMGLRHDDLPIMLLNFLPLILSLAIMMYSVPYFSALKYLKKRETRSRSNRPPDSPGRMF